MRVAYHPEFPKDIKRFEAQYANISSRLALRFRSEVDAAIEKVKNSPGSAGIFSIPARESSKKFEEQISSRFRFSCFTARRMSFWFFVPLFRARQIR
jgi:hypothetical protein